MIQSYCPVVGSGRKRVYPEGACRRLPEDLNKRPSHDLDRGYFLLVLALCNAIYLFVAHFLEKKIKASKHSIILSIIKLIFAHLSFHVWRCIFFLRIVVFLNNLFFLWGTMAHICYCPVGHRRMLKKCDYCDRGQLYESILQSRLLK